MNWMMMSMMLLTGDFGEDGCRFSENAERWMRGFQYSMTDAKPDEITGMMNPEVVVELNDAESYAEHLQLLASREIVFPSGKTIPVPASDNEAKFRKGWILAGLTGLLGVSQPVGCAEEEFRKELAQLMDQLWDLSGLPK
jgi:hypothetical protein